MPLGLYVGCVCFLLAIVAAFDVVPPLLLYAAFCVGTTIIGTFGFWRLRNSQPTRVAVLSVRSSKSTIPAYWFVATGILALSLLATPTPTAILMCVSALLSLFVAWRTTALAAMLSGVDLPAEQLVDDRLRFNRSTLGMAYALAQVCAFWLQQRFVDAVQMSVFALSIGSVVAFSVWLTLRRARSVRLA
jgi:hypothetical protein